MSREQFEKTKALYVGLACEHLASAIGASLNAPYESADTATQADLLMVAAAALKALTDCGWELMFDADDGRFLWVVT